MYLHLQGTVRGICSFRTTIFVLRKLKKITEFLDNMFLREQLESTSLGQAYDTWRAAVSGRHNCTWCLHFARWRGSLVAWLA